MKPQIPPPALAVFEVLRFDAQPGEAARLLADLDEAGWRQTLAFAGSHLRLILRARLLEQGLWDRVPAALCRQLDQNLADNTERSRRVEAVLGEIADRFTAAGVEFLVLKGFSHSPAFLADSGLRVQYDIDLYCPPEAVYRGRDLLLEMGCRPTRWEEGLPADHLPAVMPQTEWRWRGNYFDPEMPPAIDLHFQLWDFRIERLAVPHLEAFWDRRVQARLAGRPLFQLDAVDQLGYAALHAVRHLLRGTLWLFHIYEIARFLENRKGDAAFWSRWRDLHPAELRLLEAIAFRLAERWFGCSAVEAALPPDAEAWLERYGWSPVEARLRPNKHELYLHLSLLPGWADKWRVARRRLFPLNLPRSPDDIYQPADGTVRWRLGRVTRQAARVVSRLLYHGRVLLPTLWGLATWRGSRR